MILFVCSRGRLRSRTAELLCLFGGLDARSAGIDKEADVPLSDTLVRQASLIVCMEKLHLQAVSLFSHYGNCPVVQLGIPDDFDRLDPVLVRDLIYQTRFHNEAVADAMSRGRALLFTQPGYRDALGTSSPPSADNPAYGALPR